MDTVQYNGILQVIGQLSTQIVGLDKKVTAMQTEMREGFATQTSMTSEVLGMIGESFQELEGRVTKLEKQRT